MKEVWVVGLGLGWVGWVVVVGMKKRETRFEMGFIVPHEGEGRSGRKVSRAGKG